MPISSRSVLVGDKFLDISAAKVLGVGHTIFLSETDELAGPAPDIRLSSLRDIVDYLFQN